MFSIAFTICFGVLSDRFVLFFSSFPSEPCGWQGLGAPAGVGPEPPMWER